MTDSAQTIIARVIRDFTGGTWTTNHGNILARQIEDALKAAGWAVVPVEPAEAMLGGACKKHRPGEPMDERFPDECPLIRNRRKIYKAMLSEGEGG